MNAKNMPLAAILIIAFFALGDLNMLSGSADTSVQSVEMAQMKEINSLGSVLYELAAKEYEEDAKSGKIHILTVHDDNFDFAKYSNDDYIVESIPIVPEDKSAFLKFVSHYNDWNLRKADSLVLVGEYKKARALFEIMLHFEQWEVKVSILKERLLNLDKLERKEDAAKTLEIFKQSSGLGSLVRWSRLENTETQIVTNLLSVAVKPLER